MGLLAFPPDYRDAQPANHVRNLWLPDSQKPSAFARGKLTALGVAMHLRSTTLRNILVVAAAIAVLAWFYLIYLISTAPTEPNIATGHTVPSVEHGRTIYITPLVNFLRQYVAPFGVLVFFCAIAAEARRRATPNASLERKREG
jgi:hypothetical protein